MGELKCMEKRPDALYIGGSKAIAAYYKSELVWNNTVTVTLICGPSIVLYRDSQVGSKITLPSIKKVLSDYMQYSGKIPETPVENWKEDLQYDGWIEEGEDPYYDAKKTYIVPDHDVTLYGVGHIATKTLININWPVGQNGYKIFSVPFDDWLDSGYEEQLTFSSGGTFPTEEGEFTSQINDVQLPNFTIVPVYKFPSLNADSTWYHLGVLSGNGYVNIRLYKKNKNRSLNYYLLSSPRTLVGTDLWPKTKRNLGSWTFHYFGKTTVWDNLWVGHNMNLAQAPTFEATHRLGSFDNFTSQDPDFEGWTDDPDVPEDSTNGLVYVTGDQHWYGCWNYAEILNDLDILGMKHFIASATGELVYAVPQTSKVSTTQIANEGLWFDLDRLYLYSEFHSYLQIWTISELNLYGPDGKLVSGLGEKIKIEIPASANSGNGFVKYLLDVDESIRQFIPNGRWEFYNIAANIATNTNLDKYGDSTDFYTLYYTKIACIP